MFYIGIDPGASGAAAILDDKGALQSVSDLSANPVDYVHLVLNFEGWLDEKVVAIESVHALPNQSTVAGFTFGKNVGMALMTAYSISSDVHHISPTVWKKFFNLQKHVEMTKTAFKHMSVELARRIWPTYETAFAYSKDGRAEAALIALYEYLTRTGQDFEEWLKTLTNKQGL